MNRILKKQKIIKPITLFFIIAISVFGQAKLSINPGIKLGLALGEKVQFVLGFELSFVFYNLGDNDESRVGIVLDYDAIDNVKRFHVGVEYMYHFVGIDIGPTFAWDQSVPHYGFSVIAFGGALALPYINYTNIKGLNDQFDVGTYLKIPIPLTKERFSPGG